jgi:hypothetical protein
MTDHAVAEKLISFSRYRLIVHASHVFYATIGIIQSGVALRFPPQSKMLQQFRKTEAPGKISAFFPRRANLACR